MLLPINDIITSLSLMCDHVIESWLLVKFKHVHMFAYVIIFYHRYNFFSYACLWLYFVFWIICMVISKLHWNFHMFVHGKENALCLPNHHYYESPFGKQWLNTNMFVGLAFKSPINYIITWKFFNYKNRIDVCFQTLKTFHKLGDITNIFFTLHILLIPF